MDLSKTFGYIRQDLLVAELHAYGFSGETLVLFYSYLQMYCSWCLKKETKGLKYYMQVYHIDLF